MRNPLTVALLGMAIHTTLGLAVHWPYPSVATFLSGILAVVGAVVTPAAPPRATGGLAAMTLFLPAVVPVSLLLAGVAAILAANLAPSQGPLRNVAVAIPALTLLTLAITL